jgi:hypothetical protein
MNCNRKTVLEAQQKKSSPTGPTKTKQTSFTTTIPFQRTYMSSVSRPPKVHHHAALRCSPSRLAGVKAFCPQNAPPHQHVSFSRNVMAGRRASVSVLETRVEWIKAEIVNNCEACQASFGVFRRKHHCRHCGHVFCDSCTPSQMKLPPQFGYTEPQVNNNCFVSAVPMF